MPEQLTKYPEVTLQVLRSSGARCAEGAKQEILTQCPAHRFCKLPGGELCIFGSVRCVEDDSDHLRRMEGTCSIPSCCACQNIGLRWQRSSAQWQRSARRYSHRCCGIALLAPTLVML